MNSEKIKMKNKLENSLENAYHAIKANNLYKYEKNQSKKVMGAGIGCIIYLGIRGLFGHLNFNEEPENLLQSLDILTSVGGFASLFYGGLKYFKSSLGSKYYEDEIEKERTNIFGLTGMVPVFPEEQPSDVSLN